MHSSRIQRKYRTYNFRGIEQSASGLVHNPLASSSSSVRTAPTEKLARGYPWLVCTLPTVRMKSISYQMDIVWHLRAFRHQKGPYVPQQCTCELPPLTPVSPLLYWRYTGKLPTRILACRCTHRIISILDQNTHLRLPTWDNCGLLHQGLLKIQTNGVPGDLARRDSWATSSCLVVSSFNEPSAWVTGWPGTARGSEVNIVPSNGYIIKGPSRIPNGERSLEIFTHQASTSFSSTATSRYLSLLLICSTSSEAYTKRPSTLSTCRQLLNDTLTQVSNIVLWRASTTSSTCRPLRALFDTCMRNQINIWTHTLRVLKPRATHQ